MSRWTGELLDALRWVGDPLVDDAVDDLSASKCLDGGPVQSGSREDARHRTRMGPPGPSTKQLGLDRPGAYCVPESDEYKLQELRERYWSEDYGGRVHLDPRDTSLAQELFRRFGSDVGAVLLLASLPQSYAAESGAIVLAQSDALNSELASRVYRTMQFLLDVMTADDPTEPAHAGTLPHFAGEVNPNFALLCGGRGHRAVRATRLAHAQIRKRLRGRLPERVDRRVDGQIVGEPIHQEHLIGTSLTFCVTVWESLERLGVRWSERERSAWLRHWDWVAHLMGIGHLPVIEQRLRYLIEHGTGREGVPRDHSHLEELLAPFRDEGIVRPQSVTEAEDVMSLIRDRNWPPAPDSSGFDNVSGKRLTRALLAALEDAMPWPFRAFPSEMMRYFADERVKVALGLGDAYLPPTLLDWVQGQSRGWNTRRANPFFAPMARFAANQVSLHATLAWTQTTAPRPESSPDRSADADFGVRAVAGSRTTTAEPLLTLPFAGHEQLHARPRSHNEERGSIQSRG